MFNLLEYRKVPIEKGGESQGISLTISVPDHTKTDLDLRSVIMPPVN